MLVLTVLTLLLLSIKLVFCGYCPPANEIAPCVCDGWTVKCYANADFNLGTVFERIAQGFCPSCNQFTTLELLSTSLKTLPANAFHGVSFGTVRLSCPKLTCVHPQAFGGLIYATNFESFGTSFSKHTKECDLFAALRTLPWLKMLNITNSGITEIPDNAFNGEIPNSQIYLNYINFNGYGSGGEGNGGKITRIGKNAFSKLRYLFEVDLSYNQISVIDDYAFAFVDPSYYYFNLNLEHNKLTPTSFHPNSLEVNSRVTTIKLGANPTLSILNESVFYPLMMNNPLNPGSPNKVDLMGSPLDLFVGNAWLEKYRSTLNLQTKITSAMARSDGADIFLHHILEEFTQTPSPTTAGTPVSGSKGSTTTTPSINLTTTAAPVPTTTTDRP